MLEFRLAVESVGSSRLLAQMEESRHFSHLLAMRSQGVRRYQMAMSQNLGVLQLLRSRSCLPPYPPRYETELPYLPHSPGQGLSQVGQSLRLEEEAAVLLQEAV